jgi:DNA-binding MarR family transcriptional regulator
MDSFLVGLHGQQQEREAKETDGFWFGHSRFQIPLRVLGYRGKAESLILAYLYERASSISFYSKDAVLIEIKVKEEQIAKRTGLSVWAVSKGINALEADGAIRVSRYRDVLTHQVKTSVYVLLHSETREPLACSPNTYGVCHENRDRPYITAPKEAREKMVQMNPSGRQVYLAALALASVRVITSFGVRREEWKAESLLGRNAFDRGVKECVAKALLSYRRYTLTLNDPRTGKPSTRTVGRIEHANPTWEFDFKTVTPEQWQRVCAALLKREFIVGDSGWSHATRESLCPFCKEARCFRLNFQESKYQCHHCENHGRLGQLVQRVLRVTQMQKAKEFIKAVIAEQEVKAA